MTETKNSEQLAIRWYHLLALLLVILLAAYAFRLILHRFDFSVIGNSRNIKISAGCGEESLGDYRYFGIEDGQYFDLSEKGVNKLESEDEAELQIMRMEGKPVIRLKMGDEWIEETINLGEEKTYTIDEFDQCKLQARFLLSA